MLKIHQARLQQYVNCELPDVQAGFRKGRGTRDQIASIIWFIERNENSRKTSTFALLTMSKPLSVWTTTNSGKDRSNRPLYLPLENQNPCQEATARTGHRTTEWFQIG